MPFLLLIFFLYLLFPYHVQGQTLPTTFKSVPNFPSLTPIDQHSFDNYIKAIKELEIDAFLKGRSIFSIKTVTPRQIALNYKNSITKADRIYKGKQVRIIAVVNNFSRNAFNKYYIETHGNTSKDRVNIFFNPQDSRYVQYKTGDTIDLVCYGQGNNIDFPSFDQCVFSLDYFNKRYRPIEQHLASATQPNYTPVSQKELSTIILYKVLETKIQELCKESIIKCRTQIINELQNQSSQDTDAIARYIPLRDKFALLPLLPAFDESF